MQLHARGHPPGLQATCINKVGDSEKLILFPSVQTDSILSSLVPVCPFPPPFHAHPSFLTACPAVFKLNAGLGAADLYRLLTRSHDCGELCLVINPLVCSLGVVSASD